MGHLLRAFLMAAPVLLLADAARAQESRRQDAPNRVGNSQEVADKPPLLPPVGSPILAAGAPAGYILPTAAGDDRPSVSARLAENELTDLQNDLAKLQGQAGAAQAAGAGQPDDPLRKRIELLEKQIETQQKMIQLLVDQARKQPSGGEGLQTQVATLEGRSQQAARRDVELAQAIDTLTDHLDATERNGPRLPARLKELFLASGTNESPLSIYGTLSFGYSKILGDTASAANGAGRTPTPGGFYFGEFTPDFLLKLNDWIFLEAEIGIGSDGSVSAGSFAQVDFFINDWLTISAGRIVAPIGWYNLRNNPWMNKLPADAPGGAPLLWLQVLPPLSLLGVQAQGSFYLGCSPFKLEYSAFVSNGLNLTPAAAGAPTIDELANLEGMGSTFSSITNDHAVGGRLGLWWPEMGLEAGVSGLFNGDYVAGGFEEQITLFAVDLNYHKGNWDVRAEYGRTYQQAGSFGFDNITRQGMYAQLAYRPMDACNKYLQNTELVYRYSYVDFKGIDPTTLDLTTFSTPVDVPVRRNQNEIGINYYVTPRLVMKTAYQINDEPKFHLHDNQFLAELDWGW
jgi:hypothetical protein